MESLEISIQCTFLTLNFCILEKNNTIYEMFQKTNYLPWCHLLVIIGFAQSVFRKLNAVRLLIVRNLGDYRQWHSAPFGMLQYIVINIVEDYPLHTVDRCRHRYATVDFYKHCSILHIPEKTILQCNIP